MGIEERKTDITRRDFLTGAGALAATVVLGESPAGAAEVQKSGAEPFAGTPTMPVLTGWGYETWKDIQSKIAADEQTLRQCFSAGNCSPEVTRLQNILEEARAQGGKSKIGHLNRSINQALAMQTPRQGKERPVTEWYAPLDAFREHNNCRGPALAKYFALKELGGIEEADRRLVVVRVLSEGTRINEITKQEERNFEDHAMAAVRLEPGGEWYLMDNQTFFLVPDHDYFTARREGGRPLYAMSDSQVVQFLERTAAR